MKKIIGMTSVLLLVLVIFVNCKNAASSGGDSWTQITTANISSQIGTYNGTWYNPTQTGSQYIVINSSTGKIGMGSSVSNAQSAAMDAATFISTMLNADGKIYGNGSNKLKMSLTGLDIIYSKQ